MLLNAPELFVGGLLVASGLGVGYALEMATTGLALVLVGCLLAYSLRPPKHDMSGYGSLPEGKAAPTCTSQGSVTIRDTRFTDEHGRTLLLRGVNLSGASKLPASPHGVTSTSFPAGENGFYDHRNVSFVGRPFPLDRADEHFARLRLWGLTFIRLLITWEAVEHQGPGKYDEEYLTYLLAIVRKAAAHGISVFIDPHMDTWSRFCGGDGAPGWTLEVAGFDVTKVHASHDRYIAVSWPIHDRYMAGTCPLHEPRQVHASGGATVHQENGAPMLPMEWPTNNLKLAAATMYTLFFAGDDFAPKLKVGGEGIQTYLQRHYVAALSRVASLLASEPNVVGFDSLNEPSVGFAARADLTSRTGLKNGTFVTGWEAMQLGAGIPIDATRYSPIFVPRGKTRLNPTGVRAWAEGRQCPWEMHGVYRLSPSGGAELLRPDYFATKPDGSAVHFGPDYVLPLWEKVLAAIHAVPRGALPKFILFGELHLDLNAVDASKTPHEITEAVHAFDADRANAMFGTRCVALAPHWYDGLTLITKSFRPWWTVNLLNSVPCLGTEASQRATSEYLKLITQQGATMPCGGAPLLIGETGIPFDLGGPAGKDLSVQILALDRTMRAMEDALASFTLWNYTPENTSADGDRWNGEDLSVYSEEWRDSPDDLYSGGRALPALVRPYARKVAGRPLAMAFSAKDASRTFSFTFAHEDGVTAPSEFFVPHYQYPDGAEVAVTDGEWRMDARLQTLYYTHGSDRKEHTLTLSLPK